MAAYFGLSFAKARKKFTVARDDEEYAMRRKADEHFGKICQFFDTEARHCTIYKARPSVCRSYPGEGRCGYYDFLAAERRHQDDKTTVASTWNL